jgi:hypothetical protein
MSWKGNLLSCGTNAKTVKGDGSEYLTAIMYLKPYKTAGINLCAMAEQAKCIDPCLVGAGRGQMDSVQAGRLRKTEWFIRDRAGFMAQLVSDLESFVSYCAKRGIHPCVRLNGTSDIRWELIPVQRGGHTLGNLFLAFPMVTFYDYTKIANRKVAHTTPGNYSLTWSYSGASEAYAAQHAIAKANGLNIAVVFRRKGDIPATFLGLPTIDGDRDDMRFLDPKGVVVALYAKGKAKQDQSGFVVG